MRAGMTLVFLAGVLAAQTTQPEPKGVIRGVVKDTAGALLPGITVAVADGPETGGVLLVNGAVVRASSTPMPSLTDETGSYNITTLAPGAYAVKTDCNPASQWVKLDADQEATLDFVCPTNPTISGHVLDHNEDPAVDAFVWLLKSEYQNGVLKQIVIGPKVTAEDGAYTFDKGLEANRSYYVVVDRDTPSDLAADDREPHRGPHLPSVSDPHGRGNPCDSPTRREARTSRH